MSKSFCPKSLLLNSSSRTAGRIVMAVTYGLSVKTADSEVILFWNGCLCVMLRFSQYITDAETTMEMIGEAVVPGAYMVDLIPACKSGPSSIHQGTHLIVVKSLPRWLPFTSFHKMGDYGRQQIYNFVTRPFEHVKKELVGVIHRSPSVPYKCNIGRGNRPTIIRGDPPRAKGFSACPVPGRS